MIAAFISCGEKIDKSITLTSTDQAMHFDDEFQIIASSVSPIRYTSEDEYHAKVSESGLVTAGKVGETNIVLSNGSDSRKLKIAVTPESNLYPEPDLTFGMTKSQVMAKIGNPRYQHGRWSGVEKLLFKGSRAVGNVRQIGTIEQLCRYGKNGV